MRTSSKGIALIKEYEGLRLLAYKCSAGVWTIGYGHTSGVMPGMSCTEEQADAWLVEDLAEAEREVRAARTDLTQGQFDALVSFVFNLGAGKFKTSTLRKYVLSRSFILAAQEFGKWINAGGKPERGLIRRRAAEAALFQS